MRENETPSSEAEKLYTQFVLSGCQATVLTNADTSSLKSIADMLEDVRLWSMLNITHPIAACSKEELVRSIRDVTVAALNGDRTFGSEAADARHMKVQHTYQFRLREAELLEPNQNPEEINTYSRKEYEKLLRDGTKKLIHKLNAKQSNEGWLSVTDFLREHLHQNTSPENIRALSLLLKTYFGDQSASCTIDGVQYLGKQLVDFRRNVNSRSYFINPIAAPLILEKMEMVPMVYQDRKRAQWLTATEMALRIYGNNDADNIASMDYMAGKLLASKKINVGTQESPQWQQSENIVGLYRNRGAPPTYYFDPAMQEYFMERLGVVRSIPQDTCHFLSEKDLGGRARLTHQETRSAVKAILKELEAQREELEDIGVTAFDLHASVLREIAPGRRIKYYFEPELAAQYFNPEALKEHKTVTSVRVRGPRQSDVPAGYIPFYSVAMRTRSETPEEKDQLRAYLRWLHEVQHFPKMGLYPTTNGKETTYYIDPSAIKRNGLISKKSIREFAESNQSADWQTRTDIDTSTKSGAFRE